MSKRGRKHTVEAQTDDRILRQRAEEIRSLAKRTVEDIIEMGRLLTDVKEKRLPHSRWLPWLAEQMFEHDGEVTMFWRAETSSDEQLTLVTPVVIPEGMPSAEAKHMIADMIREFFREHDVVRYGHAAEAWVATDETYDGPPSEHPRRKEMISLTADDGIEFLAAMRPGRPR